MMTMGRRVVLVEPGRHLGGMTAGGLGAVDIGDPRTIGGLTRDYFTRVAAVYGKTLAWDRPFSRPGGGPATGGAFSVEPHVAEGLFNQMVRDAKVEVFLNARLATARKDGARITELIMEDGRKFRARMFIDTTYEGDLMARAGVSYTLSREGNAQYGETYNGIHYSEKYTPRTNHAQPGPNGRVPGGQVDRLTRLVASATQAPSRRPPSVSIAGYQARPRLRVSTASCTRQSTE